MPETTLTALPSFSHDQHHETCGQTEGGRLFSEWTRLTDGVPIVARYTALLFGD